MDIIKDIFSDFIDKKEIIKGFTSKIQHSIFFDKLKESHETYLRKIANEPFIKFPSRNFEINFYLSDYFDNYNTNKPARMYIRAIKDIVPYIKLLIKIYTTVGIIQKVIELYQFGREISIISIPELPYRHIYCLNNNIYQSVYKIDIYEINELCVPVFLKTITPTYYNLLNNKYVFMFGKYWNVQYIENEQEALFEKNKLAWYIFINFNRIAKFFYWTIIFAKRYKRQILHILFCILFMIIIFFPLY